MSTLRAPQTSGRLCAAKEKQIEPCFLALPFSSPVVLLTKERLFSPCSLSAYSSPQSGHALLGSLPSMPLLFSCSSSLSLYGCFCPLVFSLPASSSTLFQTLAIPQADIHDALFVFYLPPQARHWLSKPLQYIATLLGHQGPTSLASQLRRRGLATGLSVSSWSPELCTVLQVRPLPSRPAIPRERGRGREGASRVAFSVLCLLLSDFSCSESLRRCLREAHGRLTGPQGSA